MKKLTPALILGLMFFLFLGYAFKENTSKKEIVKYPNFMENLESGKIEEVILSDSEKIEFKLKNSEISYITTNPRNPELKETLLLKGVEVKESSNIVLNSMSKLSISAAFFGITIYVMYKLNGKHRTKSAMELNITDVTTEKNSECSFKDIAGNEEAKESVQDIIDFIKNPDKYSFYGARIPRGIIFYGPPGTGKTLMAKAVAGESNVPFYAVSGSDFVQMYVGVGADRIRKLFKKAREKGKAVIFIDEIDALGKKRGGVGGGNEERDQTLNALLTEMSGFASKEGIVIIAATNRLDTLDEALLRPGRFDRHIEIALPDLNARERILKQHAKNKPIATEVDFKKLARDTIYFSGAMLENLLNESAIFAAKESLPQISGKNIEKAYYTVLAGSEKTDRSNILEKEREITAYHEAGHALVAKITAPENIVSKITIIPSTKGAGGFCVNIPKEKMYYTKSELEAQIMINFAGRASEELMFGEDNVTTGASNDIEKATQIIKDYVIKYGMGKGLINTNLFGDNNTSLTECSNIAEKLYNDTKDVINKNMKYLIKISENLMKKETLCHEDLEEILQDSNYARSNG